MLNFSEKNDVKRLFTLLAIELPTIAFCGILNKFMFWHMVQEGLLNADTLTRKRALFVLKWAIDFVSNKEMFKTETNKDSFPVMFWDKKQHLELWNVWKNVMLILESFEETQLHVIQPALSVFDDIFKASSLTENSELRLLHYSWLLILLRRALLHESKPLIKWAMQYSLQMDLKKIPLLQEPDWKYIFVHLLRNLQPVFIYGGENNSPLGSPPVILHLLSKFFSSCLNVLDPIQQTCFCSKLLDVITSTSFNDISMVYITKAVSMLSMDTFPCKAVDVFQEFVFSHISTFKLNYQIVIFQNLSVFFTINSPFEEKIFHKFHSILSYALKNGIIKVDDKCWNIWLQWFGKFNKSTNDFFIEEALNKALNSYLCTGQWESTNNVGVVTLLFVHAHTCSLSSKLIEGLFSKVTDAVLKLNSNPYLDINKILKVLSLVCGILEIVVELNSNTNVKIASILNLLITYTAEIFAYFLNLCADVVTEHGCYEDLIHRSAYFVDLNMKLNVCTDNSLKSNLDQLFESLKKNMISRLEKLFTNHSVNTTSSTDVLYDMVTIKCAILLARWYGTDSCETPKYLELLAGFTVHFDRQIVNKICKNNKLKLVTSDFFIQNCWLCLDLLFKPTVLKDMRMDILERYFNDVNLVSFKKVETLVVFAKHLVVLFENMVVQLESLVDFMWRIIREQTQADQSFWNIFQGCIEVIFHPNLFLCANETIQCKLKDIWNCVLEIGSRKAGIVNLLIKQCVSVWGSCPNSQHFLDSLLLYLDYLLPVCVYGPLRRKNERPFNDLIHYLHKCNEYDGIKSLISFHSLDQSARVELVDFFLTLKDSKMATVVITRFLLSLLNFESTISKQGCCYYPNSQIHRQKIRAWQIILILVGFFPISDSATHILNQLYQTFAADNQPSVRYFIEWCILVVLIRNNELIETLWLQLDSASEKKIITVTSIFSLCIHLANYLNDISFESFSTSAIPRLLPWSQAQHMTSRIHAQVALRVIWDNMESRKLEHFKHKFNWLQHCFTLKEHNTAAVRFRKELLAKPFYSKFHPVNHYSLQSIFSGFLTLGEVIKDECIMFDQFKYKKDTTSSASFIELTTCDIDENLQGEFNVVLESLEVRHSDKQLIDMQKKIMPWRILPPSNDTALITEFEKKKKSRVSDLVLCAVLVDKIPNLGGLCRTSEIFGVGTLVLASRQYASDKNFKSLSVSSEKWVEIEQVLPIKFLQYLQRMKADGYHLVGVEQTANSKMIAEYKFPKKTVLILGNEKAGIPVDVIQHLDDCVEIPQFGVIRSLNVHISGAIMVWEYCKQHML
ncbi:probable methyltransferase TARBP1 isoform X2 [Hydractinia symbiolongicarpus]|nr:probable methyltransferase TARBP1 isoform X2 [Hydractinia symbiolongicarpus]